MNYIIVTTDALRADLANDPTLMPCFHRFLSKYGGMKFMNAYSVATWTLPVQMSLYTGLLPYHNGLYDITYVKHLHRLLKEHESLRAVKCSDDDFLITKLKKKGYVNKFFGGEYVWRYLAKSAYHLFDKSIFWDESNFFQLDVLRTEPLEKPFCYFTWDFDSGHEPYGVWPRDGRISREWRQRIPGGGRMSFLKYVHLHRDQYPQEKLFKLCRAQLKQYDKKLKHFLKWFVDEKLHEDTAIFFLSDHGEALWEHNWCGHAINCYEEIMSIPFFVYWPGRPSGLEEIDDLVSPVVDIAPTILNEQRDGDGINLFSRDKDRTAFFEFTRQWRVLDKKEEYWKKLPSLNVFIRGLRHRDYKFLYNRDVRGRVSTELYDFSQSRDETPGTQIHDEDLERGYLTRLKEQYDDI